MSDFRPTHLWTPNEIDGPDLGGNPVPVELGRPVDDREQAQYGARYAETESGDIFWTWPDELEEL